MRRTAECGRVKAASHIMHIKGGSTPPLQLVLSPLRCYIYVRTYSPPVQPCLPSRQQSIGTGDHSEYRHLWRQDSNLLPHLGWHWVEMSMDKCGPPRLHIKALGDGRKASMSWRVIKKVVFWLKIGMSGYWLEFEPSKVSEWPNFTHNIIRLSRFGGMSPYHYRVRVAHSVSIQHEFSDFAYSYKANCKMISCLKP